MYNMVQTLPPVFDCSHCVSVVWTRQIATNDRLVIAGQWTRSERKVRRSNSGSCAVRGDSPDTLGTVEAAEVRLRRACLWLPISGSRVG